MDLVERAARLREARVPHVLATVVRARTPSSGKPGDRAIVRPVPSAIASSYGH
jgi:xanthine/CO dehydrogenase XdhC/CoxF family maturation factor